MNYNGVYLTAIVKNVSGKAISEVYGSYQLIPFNVVTHNHIEKMKALVIDTMRQAGFIESKIGSIEITWFHPIKI